MRTLFARSPTFLSRQQCEVLFQRKWGTPAWNAILWRVKDQEGLVRVGRQSAGVHGHPYVMTSGYELSQDGMTLMAWEHDTQTKPAPTDLDTLTGLPLLKSLNVHLGDLVKEALENAAPLGVVMVDVDNFKRVNDTHGHPAGNNVLREIAARLTSVVRGKGAAYRYGGEEMALLLPNHTLDEALAVAERARHLIAATPCAGITVTASFGVAIAPDHASDAASLIVCADNALYDAKGRGRNLVRFAGEPPPTHQADPKPRRKQPEGGKPSESVLQSLRKDYFRGLQPQCPIDGSRLTFQELRTGQSRGDDLLVYCPGCGLQEEILADK